DFERKPRISVLTFIGVSGLLDYFNTDGTFDRVEFTQCYQNFVRSPRGMVRQYLGRNSIWNLDGAAIHRHPKIIYYFGGGGV
ncbi:hypothetical protein L915_03167, partial [Phytophthora nicotianae]